MSFYWLMRHVVGGPLLNVYFRPWARGAAFVPTEGPAILASNHLAVIDSFVLPLVLDRQVKFLGKSDYFTGTGVKGKAVAGFMRGMGTIPVDRSGGKAAGALKAGLQVLKDGGLFGIYPEGTRSPDGRLYRGKTGVARLALQANAPVIPVAMIGTEEAQPLGQTIPKPTSIGVIFGEPLNFSQHSGKENDREILRAITDEIVFSIQRLSGQEYVDIYAATMKARLGLIKPEADGDTQREPRHSGHPTTSQIPIIDHGLAAMGEDQSPTDDEGTGAVVEPPEQAGDIVDQSVVIDS